MKPRSNMPPRTPPPAIISPARAAAFRILERIAASASHSDDLLHAPAVDALSSEDRNLTTTLVLGVLRWQLVLDEQIRALLQRPDVDLHPAAMLALRLGAFQLKHLDRVPAHAAVHESVELARANGAAYAVGIVNAVLRRMIRESGADAVERKSLVAATPAERAHPQWLIARWRRNFGGAATRRIAEYDQALPSDATLFSDALAEGMDDGSRLVAEIAAAALEAPRRILDCCAAPGGKTAVLAARHVDAEVVAADISPRRLSAMQQRFKANPQTAKVNTLAADMTKPSDDPLLAPGFDLILCDVPCSGTGTLARNPEIRHRLLVEDLARQAERQRSILSNAFTLLAPGGVLVYSTCSLEPDENEGVVASVMKDAGAMARDARAVIDQIGSLSVDGRAMAMNATREDGTLRTLPGTVPCDGFFAALLSRTS